MLFDYFLETGEKLYLFDMKERHEEMFKREATKERRIRTGL